MSGETSIVVRAFNEAKHLPRLVEAIRAQTYTDFETVLVDSGSIDGTVELGRASFDKVVEIDSRDFTFGYSLNRGCAAASGRHVVVLSAHAYPAHERWLEALVRNLSDDGVALVYGSHLPVPETKISEQREFEQLFGPERRVQRAPDYYCNNANAAIRRDLWEQHPYDESLTGIEDQAWAKYWMDRGYVIVYEPEAAVHHVHEESWAQVERRYYREAFARRQLQLDRRRRIPRALLEGAGQWMGDLGSLRSAGRLDRHAVTEVSRYRYHQARGAIRGLVHDYDPAREHEELFFDRRGTAVVIRGPGDASLEERALPEVKPNDVLIAVSYVGVCATDLEVLEGRLGYYRSGRASYPIVPGHEYAGVVAKIGANVRGIAPTDKVVGACILGCLECEPCRAGNPAACATRREVGVLNHDGAYSDFVAVPSQHVHVLDPDADLARHALVEPLAVVTKGVGRLLEGVDGRRLSCAVVGVGSIGNLAAQLLALRGHEVTGFDLDPARLDALPASVGGRETELAGLDRFDLMVEASGSREALEQVLREAAPGARVLLLGLPYGDMTYNFEDVVVSDRAVVGSLGSGPDDFRAAIQIIPQLELAPFMRLVFPLDRYREAWDAHRSRVALKIMLAVGA